MDERTRAGGWDGSVLLDAGDALNAAPYLVAGRMGEVEATARFLVDEYNREGVAAMTLGERELALGEPLLKELAERAKFPFLGANVLSREGEPAFHGWTVVKVAGIRVGVIGLVSEMVAKQAILGREDRPAPPWLIGNPVEAAKKAVTALEAEGVDLVVVLSHLKQTEEDDVAKAVPRVALFLGTHDMGISTETRLAGSAVAVSAGQKGKYVAITTVKLPPAWKGGDAVVDAGRREALVGRIARSKQMVESLQARLDHARAQAEAPDADGPKGAAARRKPGPPIQMWEQQLAGAKAELQIAEMDLKDLESADADKGGQGTVGSAMFELVSLTPQVADEPETKARVDAFRVDHPDPAKASGH
ncbi:MAG: hypothetical protein KC635_01855 [Myxococcales bacterium]|nr:hypothetical protein [Myxococcales bacterium]